MATNVAALRVSAQMERTRDKKLLATLKAKIAKARARRKSAIKRATALCRRTRVKVAAEVRAYRAEQRARVNADVDKRRAEARRNCKARKALIMASGRSVESKRKATLAEQRRLFASLKRYEKQATAKTAGVASAAQRRQESDQTVRYNLPAELAPVFSKVRRIIKASANRSRTEAFLDWAHNNPEEVADIQNAQAEREMRALIAEREKLERKQYREQKATRKKAAPAARRRKASTARASKPRYDDKVPF